ncbi:hypothetical protein QYF36_023703 [Acer negundo]|nr:hypothetical protein QYF36_023703 [Acer negundo]
MSTTTIMVEFRENNDGELIAMGGQMRLNGDGLNGEGLGLIKLQIHNSFDKKSQHTQSLNLRAVKLSEVSIARRRRLLSPPSPFLAAIDFFRRSSLSTSAGRPSQPHLQSPIVPFLHFFSSSLASQQAVNGYLAYEFSDLFLAENVGLGNQGWENDFVDAFLNEKIDKLTRTSVQS